MKASPLGTVAMAATTHHRKVRTAIRHPEVIPQVTLHRATIHQDIQGLAMMGKVLPLHLQVVLPTLAMTCMVEHHPVTRLPATVEATAEMRARADASGVEILTEGTEGMTETTIGGGTTTEVEEKEKVDLKFLVGPLVAQSGDGQCSMLFWAKAAAFLCQNLWNYSWKVCQWMRQFWAQLPQVPSSFFPVFRTFQEAALRSLFHSKAFLQCHALAVWKSANISIAL